MISVIVATVRQIGKSAIVLTMLGVIVLVLLLADFAAGTAFAGQNLIMFDLGYFFISVLAMLLAMFIANDIIASELTSGTGHYSLTKGVSRTRFFLGKFCGINLVMVLFLLLFHGLLTMLLPGSNRILALSWFLLLAETVVITAVAVLLTVILPKTPALIFSVLFFIAGHLRIPSELLPRLIESPWKCSLMRIIYVLTPNLELFNVKYVMYLSPGPGYLVHAAWYSLTYAGIVLLLAVHVLKHKDL